MAVVHTYFYIVVLIHNGDVAP